MKFPPFDYLAPADVDEAIEALTVDEDAKVLAGGQSLLPLMALRLARPSVVVDLGRLDVAPAAIDPGPGPAGTLRLGALTRQAVLEEDAAVGSAAPLVAAAVRHVGHRATRALGTIGGSLAHADPAAELPAVMVALEASVVTRSPRGTRTIPCATLASGFFTTCLDHDEVIIEVHVPAAAAGTGSAWCEWAARSGDFAEAGVGVNLEPGDDGSCAKARAAASGVAPTPVDLSSIVSPLLTGVNTAGPSVLREIAAAVAAECVSELAGLLAARAVHRAMAAMGRGSERTGSGAAA